MGTGEGAGDRAEGRGDMPDPMEEKRAALHAAISRAGQRPLCRCPEVLRLSRELDLLIEGAQREGE